MQEMERRLNKVLEDHKVQWKIERLKQQEGMEEGDGKQRKQRSGFPTIKRKRKKIRACQNMAGKSF